MSALPPQPISPLDGRYRAAVSDLGDYLSEAGLNKARVRIEVEWLIFLTDRALFGSKPLDDSHKDQLRSIYQNFGQTEIDRLATLESTTKHDVKAVEYLIRERLDADNLNHIAELTHFAATSEDINNLAYALTVKEAVTVLWLPSLRLVIDMITEQAREHRSAAMLARTHGQPATPTTMGKELAVFVYRLTRITHQVEASEYLGKFSGATGTFAAHQVAGPAVSWPQVSREFVTSLGLQWNPLTTQIESHDWQAELYSRISHANRILHNLCTDVWSYISLGYFRQTPEPGATGSSTMPHKVNPIRFENAEANLELSCAVLDSLSATLVTSRLQRDLTDSTSQRNIGVGIGHSLLALDNIRRGLHQISLDPERLHADLNDNWEVLAEAIQTVIRAEVTEGKSSIADPYSLLKELTRGKRVDRESLATFIRELDVSESARTRLLELTPETYTGVAADLVDLI